jgi:hypothetical protein
MLYTAAADLSKSANCGNATRSGVHCAVVSGKGGASLVGLGLGRVCTGKRERRGLVRERERRQAPRGGGGAKECEYRGKARAGKS